MTTPFEGESDENLVTKVELGLSGQGAAIEMMLRLKNAVQALQAATERLHTETNRLTRRLLWFTFALVLLGVIQLWVAVVTYQASRAFW